MFQEYVILNGNKTRVSVGYTTIVFQEYVILNGNKTVLNSSCYEVKFYEYVILNGNKTNSPEFETIDRFQECVIFL